MIFIISHFLLLAGVIGIYLFTGRLKATFRYRFLRAGLVLTFIAPAVAALWPYDLPVALPVEPVSLKIAWPLWIFATYCVVAGWRIGQVIFSYVRLSILVQRLPVIGHEGRITLREGRSPFAFGLFRRAIILPPGERDLLLCHERIHALRFDPLWLFSLEIVRALFFFSPFHRYFAKSFELEMELSCDELVLEKWPLKRRAYAELLLVFATGPNVVYGRMAMGASKSNLSRRIESMSQLRKNHPLHVAIVVAALSLTVLSVAGFTAVAVAQPTVQEIFGNRSMTLEAKKTAVRSLLEFVLRAQNVKYSLSPGVGDRLVSVTVKKAQVSEIFDFLITSGSLSYIVSQDGTLQIGPAKVAK